VDEKKARSVLPQKEKEWRFRIPWRKQGLSQVTGPIEPAALIGH
jgi:hypothetical protein